MAKGATVQVLERGLDIIEQLAASEKGMSIMELSIATGLPKPTVHRILGTFAERHYIEKDPETSIYSIGNKFVEIASIYLNKIVLKTEAEPIMRRLAAAFKATSYLGILEGLDVVYLERIEAFNDLRTYTEIGKREPLYCTALGKVLMAAMPKEEFEHLAQQFSYAPLTSKTLTDYSELARDVEKVRVTGYALDPGEHTEGSSCLAVPIRDYTGQVIAAMSISGFDLLEKYPIEVIYREISAASSELSQRMGYSENVSR